MTNDNKAIHCFERANLGKYPFTCTGVTYETFKATPESPTQPGASCDYCGTGIMYVYHVRGADGRTFKVGSDCIAKTGDAGLIGQRKAIDRVASAEKRAAQRQARATARSAQWQKEADARRAGFEARYGELLRRAEPFCERNDFVRDVCRKARERAMLTDGQVTALEKVIDRMAADDTAKATSGHVGTVGERIERKVTVARVNSFDRPAYGTGRMETVWVITMRDEAGNSIVCKSPSFHAEQGETFTVRGTVKEHSEFRGEKQTVIQRAATR